MTMPIYEAIKTVLSLYSGGYEIKPPYMEKAADLNRGYITYYETGRRAITGRKETFNEKGELITSYIEEVNIQLEVIKLKGGNAETQRAAEQAIYLKGVLSSRAAHLAFYECGYELVNLYDNVRIEGYWAEHNRWSERVYFPLRFYCNNIFISEEDIFNNFSLKIKAV